MSQPEGGAAKPGGGYIVMMPTLTKASSPQLDALRRLARGGGGAARIDLAAVRSFDDEGARLLADALREVRRSRSALAMERPEKLRSLLEAAAEKGRDGGEGAWLLLLELLQWQGDQAAFDDRAVAYAVTFELSPPSWEPPVAGVPAPAATPGKMPAHGADAEAIGWSHSITGASPPPLAHLLEFAERRSNVLLDMTLLERIDFVAAGALVNAIHRLEAQHKAFQVVGASPIIRALLLLVGLRPEHFARKHS